MAGKLVGIARRSKPRESMEKLEQVKVTEEKGLDLDARGATPGRQVTILFQEDWAAACEEIGETLPWTTRRANLLVEGIANPAATGSHIHVGGVTLKVSEETEPCSLMERSRSGLREALQPKWRGGLSCNVIEGGEIAIGDDVTVATEK